MPRTKTFPSAIIVRERRREDAREMHFSSEMHFKGKNFYYHDGKDTRSAPTLMLLFSIKISFGIMRGKLRLITDLPHRGDDDVISGWSRFSNSFDGVTAPTCIAGAIRRKMGIITAWLHIYQSRARCTFV